MVNLDLYRVFYTVAKKGSLTKAAEELYISQPAVSQAVKQLENQLGTPLFNRTHRGMELSETGGRRIFDKVERALRLLEEAEEALHTCAEARREETRKEEAGKEEARGGLRG
ncbi:MAG: LysR family transcriptional regulator [Candidatus Scatosoma sp.]